MLHDVFSVIAHTHTHCSPQPLLSSPHNTAATSGDQWGQFSGETLVLIPVIYFPLPFLSPGERISLSPFTSTLLSPPLRHGLEKKGSPSVSSVHPGIPGCM